MEHQKKLLFVCLPIYRHSPNHKWEIPNDKRSGGRLNIKDFFSKPVLDLQGTRALIANFIQGSGSPHNLDLSHAVH